VETEAVHASELDATNYAVHAWLHETQCIRRRHGSFPPVSPTSLRLHSLAYVHYCLSRRSTTSAATPFACARFQLHAVSINNCGLSPRPRLALRRSTPQASLADRRVRTRGPKQRPCAACQHTATASEEPLCISTSQPRRASHLSSPPRPASINNNNNDNRNNNKTPTMVTQRRYSVTGQTPPEDAEAMKAEHRSPKLQALDTNVPSTSCGFCESGAEAGKLTTAGNDSGADGVRGRKMAQAGTVVRTSSKRSATQLPSPNSPSHELPPKIPRYRRGHHDDADTDLDTDAEEEEDPACHSQATSLPSSPEHSHPRSVCGLPDAASLQKLQLHSRDGSEDDCMEDLALSPSHSRNHSLDCAYLDHKSTLQEDWAAYQRTHWLPPPEIAHIEVAEESLPDKTHVAPTLLTLPPEIRHHIYRNCEELVFKQPLLYCIATAFDKIQHPLACVSRQVRSEALAIFYSYNTWTVKVEFRMMYEGFQHWIIRLGEGAGSLRRVDFSVRGTLFKPKRTHTQSVLVHGQLIQITPGVAANGREELYSPPDGDASFKIDLSEKHPGGKVELVRNDGTKEAGETGRQQLANMVEGLWEKRRARTLNGQDWVNMVDNFITFIGGWVSSTNVLPQHLTNSRQ
jgi:hypothetical protein